MWRSGESVVKDFVAAVNREDAAAARAVLDQDCVWIDSRDNRVEGADECGAALQLMFESNARFRIHVDDMVMRHDEFLMSGRTEAEGEHSGSRVLWRVKVGNGRLKSWQSFRDAATPSMARRFAPTAVTLD